jgi:hypothetical protein
LAASGEDRVVETLAAYLGNTHLHPTMRLAAGTGRRVLGNNRYLYGEEPRQRAVLNQPFWPTAWYFYICMQHFIYFTRHLL